MNTFEMISEVTKHLHTLNADGCACVPVNLVDNIVKAGEACGMVICGGAYDPDTKQRYLYIG